MMDDGGDETDWLDVWMGSLAVEGCSEMSTYAGGGDNGDNHPGGAEKGSRLHDMAGGGVKGDA